MYIICSSVCRMYASYAAVYAVCKCIIRSCVCSVCMYHMQLRPEADGCWQPITTEGPLSAYSSSSSSFLFILLMLLFGKFNAISISRFWWLQLRFHFGLPLSGDLSTSFFAQLVPRCLDSETVTRMTQGSLNPAARCTLSEGLAARRLSRKWHTFIILATSLHCRIKRYSFMNPTLPHFS